MFFPGKLGIAAAVLLTSALAASAQDAAKTSTEPIKLEHKWPEGQKRSLTSVTKVEQTMTIQGMEIETTTEQIADTSYSIGKRRDDGTLPVESKVESFKASMNFPGGISLDYDSKHPEATEAQEIPQLQQLVDSLKVSADVSFTFVLDKDGKIAAVEGAENILQKLQESNPDVADMLRERFQADSMKKTISDEFQYLPDTLVRPGDSWTRKQTQDLGMGQTLTYETRYEYTGTVQVDGKTLDKITSKATSVTYNQNPNAAGPAKVTASDLKVESSDGTILFDREAGTEVEKNDKVRLVGSMTMEAMGQELEVQLDLSMENSSKLK